MEREYPSEEKGGEEQKGNGEESTHDESWEAEEGSRRIVAASPLVRGSRADAADAAGTTSRAGRCPGGGQGVGGRDERRSSSEERVDVLGVGGGGGPWGQREAALERIRKVGRRQWQRESGYRQQGRVENGFFRYKSVLGGSLKARNSNAQKREAMIGCHILNRMAELGKPKSYAVVS